MADDLLGWAAGDASVGRLAATLRERWSVAYLRSTHPRTPVDVSVTSRSDGLLAGTVEAHETITMAFGEQFLGQVDEAWGRRPSKLRYHLAQCELTQLPALHADVRTPDCVADAARRAGSAPRAHLWLCIGAGRSALHYDCFDGLLLVVRGEKTIALLPPSSTRELSPRPAHALSANHSTLSADELRAALAGPRATRVRLRAGDALHVPEGWWHVVDSAAEGEAAEGATLAINWWWRGAATRSLSQDAAGAAAAAAGVGRSPEPVGQYVLRSAFERAARDEERRMLALAAGLDPEATSADAVAVTGRGCGLAADDDEQLASALLDEMEDGDAVDAPVDSPALLRAILAPRAASRLPRALGVAAGLAPRRLADLLCRRLGPAGAHALGLRIQSALSDPSAEDAAASAAAVERAFECVGDSNAERHAARQRLLDLAREFADAAAANVLRQTLGLDVGALASPKALHAGESRLRGCPGKRARTDPVA